MKQHFINELESLCNRIIRQGEAAEQTIRKAILAFRTNNTQLAQRIISDDEIINHEEIQIEEECLKILALYQPVASDLRMVISYIKINTILERIADFGCHIAKLSLKIADFSKEQCDFEIFDFTLMENLTLDMLHNSLNVIRDNNTVLAHKVIDNDNTVDLLRQEHRNHARKAIVKNPAMSEYYVACFELARELERIADLSTDICQQIIYLQTGQIIRHTF